jgi:hypothetical protein
MTRTVDDLIDRSAGKEGGWHRRRRDRWIDHGMDGGGGAGETRWLVRAPSGVIAHTSRSQVAEEI